MACIGLRSIYAVKQISRQNLCQDPRLLNLKTSPDILAEMSAIFVYITVMIRFSARGTRGANELLVPQGRALIGERALIRDGVLICF